MYVLNVMFWKSIDGGQNFKPIRTPHGDNHALWINPDDPANLIEGNDGGANITFNGGRTWSVQSNQPTSEIYRVTVDDQHPYWLYGGQQDNSAVAIPSRSPGGIDVARTGTPRLAVRRPLWRSTRATRTSPTAGATAARSAATTGGSSIRRR